MSGMTHAVKPLPPGTTPERALADALAELLEADELLEGWERAVAESGTHPVHIGMTKTYGEMLETAKKRKSLATMRATSVLYSVGRWTNPPTGEEGVDGCEMLKSI